jgi:hypothetical protein
VKPADRGRVSALADGWDRFWFSEASPVGLACFRIVFALCLLREVVTSSARATGAVADGYHWPYASWIPRLAEPLYDLLHAVQIPLILLLALGLATRPAALGLAAIQGWIFFADRLQFRNHPWFFLIVLLLLIPSPAGHALSLDAARRARSGGRTSVRRHLTCQRLIQAQVSIVYAFAALHKLHPAWLRGDVLRNEIPALASLSGGAAVDRWLPGLALLVVVLELTLALGLWIRPARVWAIVCGVAFHAVIAGLLGAGAFSLALIASYFLFLDPGGLERLFLSVRHGTVREPAMASREPATPYW